jgi:hypothetical protein
VPNFDTFVMAIDSERAQRRKARRPQAQEKKRDAMLAANASDRKPANAKPGALAKATKKTTAAAAKKRPAALAAPGKAARTKKSKTSLQGAARSVITGGVAFVSVGLAVLLLRTYVRGPIEDGRVPPAATCSHNAECTETRACQAAAGCLGIGDPVCRLDECHFEIGCGCWSRDRGNER